MTDPVYYSSIQQYQTALKHYNTLLKKNVSDKLSYTAYASILADEAAVILPKREAAIRSLSEKTAGILQEMRPELAGFQMDYHFDPKLMDKDFFLAKPISFMVFFAMIFSGGVVPWYIVCTKILHLKNTFAGLILPYAVVPWFVLLMKGFFTSVPREIIESAKIDGCGDIRAFFSVVVPISVPALTTVGLFIALNYWNDYKLALYFVQDADMYPLQYMLQQMMSNLNFMRTSMAASHGINLNTKLPSESVRMGMCLLAAGPMLLVFPFFQKYFVKGLTVGAVKG